MEENEKIRVLEATLARLLAWITFVDSRAQHIVALGIALLGVLAASAAKPDEWSCATGVLVVSATLLVVAALACCFIAVFPRTKGPEESLIYLGPIALLTGDQFRKAVDARSSADYVRDLADQCHVNATIARKKFSLIKASVILLIPGTLVWLVSMFFLYF